MIQQVGPTTYYPCKHCGLIYPNHNQGGATSGCPRFEPLISGARCRHGTPEGSYCSVCGTVDGAPKIVDETARTLITGLQHDAYDLRKRVAALEAASPAANVDGNAYEHLHAVLGCDVMDITVDDVANRAKELVTRAETAERLLKKTEEGIAKIIRDCQHEHGIRLDVTVRLQNAESYAARLETVIRQYLSREIPGITPDPQATRTAFMEALGDKE